jgi:hypothetical protein
VTLPPTFPFTYALFTPARHSSLSKRWGILCQPPKQFFVIEQLIDALRYLHEHGRTHCDFHQHNILIHEDVFTHGILIIDFGSGHRESDSSAATAERGDFRYKPPEAQARYRNQVLRSKAGQGFRSADFSALGHLLALMSDGFFGDAPRDQQVSGDVPVGEAILAIVNSPTFQKLKGLKQLSFCEWLYPGAVHTRFEHSIGVMNVALRALGKLARNVAFRDRFTQQNVEGAILASLSHDIGHYPFAHMIEHYVASRFPGDRDVKQLVHHATYTIDHLEKNRELRAIIDQHWGENGRLEAIKVLEGSIPVVSDLLDGPIDCDKLDYIQRDAHHCGVPFGAGLDIAKIVESYRCISNAGKLGIDRSGVSAVEGLMIVQEQMLDTVYWNETIRAVTVMFHAVIATIVRRDVDELRSLVGELRTCVFEYQALRDVIIRRIKKLPAEVQDELKPLYNLHLQPNAAEIYVPIKKYTATDGVPNQSAARTSIYHAILRQPSSQTSTVPIDWKAVQRLRECYRLGFESKIGGKVGTYEVLVDVPWGKSGSQMVYVSEDGGTEQPIVDVSHLDSSIFDRPTMHLAPIRVFVSPRLNAQYEQHLAAVSATA